MAQPVQFQTSGDAVYAVVPEDFPGGLPALVEQVRQRLPGIWVDWVAVREAFLYGRGRRFPVGNRTPERALDEKAKIRFSPDDLAAYLILYPPKPRGTRLTEAELQELAGAYGIPDALLDTQSLRLAHLRRSYQQPEPIARGRAPVHGGAAWVDWHCGVPTDPEGFLAAAAGWDHYPEQVLGSARAGQTVGVRHPPGAGRGGLSAQGRTIAPQPGRDPLELGGGLVLTGDGCAVVPTRDGHLRLGGAGGIRAEVTPLLVVHDPQELEPWSSTPFPGSVVVEGDLEVPFPVRVAGDLEVRGGVVRSTLEVMGSLLVRDGVIQQRSSPLKVGGIASAAFFERTWVLAHTVHVRDHSLKSRLFALDALVSGPEAHLQGGNLTVGRRLQVATLGSRNAMPTELVGGDAGVVHSFRELYGAWAELLRQPGEGTATPSAPLLALAEHWEREADALSIPDALQVHLDAQLVHPGVTVRIGPASRKIENPVGPVRLAYERIGPRGRVALNRDPG